MTRRILSAFALLGLVACASYDLSANAHFKPTVTGFEYTNIADTVYPVDSTKAEALRLARLDQFVTDTGVCQNGYTITSRTPVNKLRPNAVSAGIFDIHYIGRCL